MTKLLTMTQIHKFPLQFDDGRGGGANNNALLGFGDMGSLNFGAPDPMLKMGGSGNGFTGAGLSMSPGSIQETDHHNMYSRPAKVDYTGGSYSPSLMGGYSSLPPPTSGGHVSPTAFVQPPPSAAQLPPPPSSVVTKQVGGNFKRGVYFDTRRRRNE